MKTLLIGLAVAAGMTACSGAGGTSSGGQVSQTTADGWSAKWCQAQPGVDREQLIAIMGAPTNKSDTTMTWSAHQYQFNAFFDEKGTVKQLDTNTHSLSAAEQSALPCEPIRTPATISRAAAKAAAKPARTFPEGCALVTEAEMSAILDAPMQAVARQGGGTECNYSPKSGISPAVKLTVDWGDGRIAMKSAGFMGAHEPGLTSPYDGVGDQAVAVGPALMIRTGEDLMTIVFTGVTGAPAAAKRIFDTAKARMP